MPATSTGTPGTTIPASCSVPSANEFVTGAGLLTAIDPINDDLATIRAGNVTISGNKTFSGVTTFSGDVHVAQTKSIIADGTGATISGTWTVAGPVVFDTTSSVEVKGTIAFKSTNINTHESGSQDAYQAGSSLVTAIDAIVTHRDEVTLENGAASPSTVTGATNATPIVITTGTAHGYSDGDLIIIESVGGNTVANDEWIIDVLTSTTFSLIGSVGSGAYTSGGTTQRRSQIAYSATRALERACANTWDSGGGDGVVSQAWYYDASSGAFVNRTASPTSSVQYRGWEIDAPTGSSITSATATFEPASGHANAPAAFPVLTIYKMKFSTGARTSLASQTSGNGTPGGAAGPYQVFTSVSAILGTPEIVDRRRYRYFAVLSTETSTDALEGMKVYGAIYVCNARHIDQL